ncbi:hypothetical protein [Inconstantimicrobium mannanitabidum]|uniref:Uncharacterized protein n=1 Tax=Inconstantimicrobium mannanitabidum TaxID=1604901 RepID=A0ACB5RIL9_9CLOT|nr:hypothetical protein [Clostridium sp. TW13]GKX68934.1 hypothetical protein rsdtw13_41920 [Clostridium sp. TW13]
MSYKTYESIEIIISAGAKAAAVAGGYKGVLHMFPGAGQMVQLALLGVEVGALTKVTTKMCKRIVKVYDCDGISGISSFIGVVVGAASGNIIAGKLLELIPGVGVAAGAITTFSLHALTGILITAVCELIDENLIDKSFINNPDIKFISYILDLMTESVADIARGYFSGKDLKDSFSNAIDLIKVKLNQPKLQN